MANESNQSLNTFNKVVCLFIVVITFSFLFVVLIRKQQGNNLGDLLVSSKLQEKTIYGKEILARDMDAIYPKYYVVYTMNNTYVVQSINYYETESQFNLEFSRLLNSIADYNRKEKMIRYDVSRGEASYDELKNNLSFYVGAPNLVIYE